MTKSRTHGYSSRILSRKNCKREVRRTEECGRWIWVEQKRNLEKGQGHQSSWHLNHGTYVTHRLAFANGLEGLEKVGAERLRF